MITEKCCEWCGKSSNKYMYRFIVEPEYILYLNSPLVLRIDRQNQVVTLRDGSKLDYSVEQPDQTAILFKELIPHIFCSESCEDNFVNTHTVTVRNDIHLKTAALSFKQEGYFVPLSIPVEKIKHTTNTCTVCKNTFPNVSKQFQSMEIRSLKEIPGELNVEPKTDYAVVFSDISKKHPKGKYYCVDLIIPPSKVAMRESFCSNECVFEYASNKSACILFKNNIMQGYLTCITPVTVKINDGLGNPYKYRPQKMQH